MHRRRFLAAAAVVPLAGCTGMFEDDPDPPTTEGDDDSPFEIGPTDTNPLSLAPSQDDLPVIDEQWGAANLSYDHYPPSHTRTFRSDDRSVSFTATTFETVEESDDFLVNARWNDQSETSVEDHGIGTDGYFYSIDRSVHVVFRDANIAGRVTMTEADGGLLDRGVGTDEVETTFDLAVAWHETWR